MMHTVPKGTKAISDVEIAFGGAGGMTNPLEGGPVQPNRPAQVTRSGKDGPHQFASIHAAAASPKAPQYNI